MQDSVNKYLKNPVYFNALLTTANRQQLITTYNNYIFVRSNRTYNVMIDGEQKGKTRKPFQFFFGQK